MASNIYDLYLSYKDKEIDEDFINKSFEYMMKNEEDLYPYIRDFIITDENVPDLGNYSNENKIIKINKKNINENIILSKNILALEVIKHEIEHARNLQKLEQLKQDIETKVIFYSLRNYALEQGLDKSRIEPLDRLMLLFKINQNYEINPGERIANIKSWKYILNLVKNQNRTKDLLDARIMLYYSYIRGYKDNRYYLESPTYNFLLETNQLNDLKDLKSKVNNSNYSLDTRLLYGLPISYKEYNEDTLTKTKLQKKRIRK